MPALSNDALAALIAAPVIAALVWLVKYLVTAAREREAAQSATLSKFAEAAVKQSEATATNSAVMQTLTGAIDRLSASLTAEVRGIREDLDELTPKPCNPEDDTPIARPRLVTERRPARGQKDD